MTYFKGLARDVWQMIVPDFEARKRRKQDEQAFRETVVAETGFTEAGEIMVRIVRAVSKRTKYQEGRAVTRLGTEESWGVQSRLSWIQGGRGGLPY